MKLFFQELTIRTVHNLQQFTVGSFTMMSFASLKGVDPKSFDRIVRLQISGKIGRKSVLKRSHKSTYLMKSKRTIQMNVFQRLKCDTKWFIKLSKCKIKLTRHRLSSDSQKIYRSFDQFPHQMALRCAKFKSQDK